ncbi:epidermal retinol dehydrogenase 2-like [Penaeus japonicus]|uniref:epidermal retinol dehydrogenase 2-like n=1 Tax=Penaeus japonicus TaxID=27405 RepID=UPI001C70D621|nr:epidermal retinol dehydrogenase 2-like [Penaeus japonicus]
MMNGHADVLLHSRLENLAFPPKTKTFSDGTLEGSTTRLEDAELKPKDMLKDMPKDMPKGDQEDTENTKIGAWEVMAMVVGFIVLNVKAVVLILIDIYHLVFPPEEKEIHGQLVLVTGSGQNLGRELSLQLARMGAKLILWDYNESHNEETADMIREIGGEVYTFTCDISDQKSVAAAAARVRRDIGHPAFVFNNAGTYEHKPFLSHTPDEIRRLVEVNLLGNLWVRPSAMMGVGSVLLLPYSKSCRWVSLFGIVACLS